MGYTPSEIEELLASHARTYNVGSGVSTVTTVSSTAADDAGDQRDENIRGINNIRLDIDTLQNKFGDLLTTLRERNLIPE